MTHSRDNEDRMESRSDLQSLKRVWALAGPLRSRVALGILLRFGQSMCLGFSFGVVAWAVVVLAVGQPATVIMASQAAGLMGLSLIGQMVFGYFSVRASWLSSYRVAGELRLQILDHLRRLPMGFHLSRHKGDTVTVLTSDMQMIEVFFSDSLPKVAQALGLPIVIFIFLFFRDWVIALTAVVSIAAAVPAILLSSKWLSKLGIQRQDTQAGAAARMIEYVKGIAVIRSFNQIFKGQESFDGALKAFRDISITLIVKLAAPLVTIGAILMLGVPLIIIVAGMRYFNGAIDMGTLLTTLVLLFSIYLPLLALVSMMEVTRIADASLTRMERILVSKALPQTELAVSLDGFAVRFRDVDFGYVAGRTVLDKVSFEVPEYSMTAIVGPSGSGKSTILNLLSRFWDVENGSVSIGGVDVREIPEAKLNELITVVFQDVYLFAGTILDNIAFGRGDVDLSKVEAAAKAAQAHDFIMDFPDGYHTIVGEGGTTLSGGERQRISIARAILKDAPIVLLDEATAAIDPITERAIQTALASLVAEKTLIVVSHKLSTIEAADQIITLNAGQIAERGTHKKLLSQKGLYAQLWNHHTRAVNWKVKKGAKRSKSKAGAV